MLNYYSLSNEEFTKQFLKDENDKEIIVYLGKPPISSKELSFYVELARKVRGGLLIKPVKEELLFGENDEIHIILKKDFSNNLEKILKEVNIKSVKIKENCFEYLFEYIKGKFERIY